MSKKIVISIIAFLIIVGLPIIIYNNECNDNRSFVILRETIKYADSHMFGSDEDVVKDLCIKDLCTIENNLLIEYNKSGRLEDVSHTYEEDVEVLENTIKQYINSTNEYNKSGDINSVKEIVRCKEQIKKLKEHYEDEANEGTPLY